MYLQEEINGLNYVHVAADLDDLTGAAVHTSSIGIMAQQKAVRLCALITTAVVSTGAVVVTYWRRPTYGSTASQVSLGTLSIPAGTAAGKVLYKDVSPAVCAPGDQITFEVTTAAAGGGAAGEALYGVGAELDPEAAANQTDMIASA